MLAFYWCTVGFCEYDLICLTQLLIEYFMVMSIAVNGMKI